MDNLGRIGPPEATTAPCLKFPLRTGRLITAPDLIDLFRLGMPSAADSLLDNRLPLGIETVPSCPKPFPLHDPSASPGLSHSRLLS